MAVFGINYLSHVLLTMELGQLHRNVLEGEVQDLGGEVSTLRIINVVSGSYTENEVNFDDVTYASRTGNIYRTYGESKLALLLFSVLWPRITPDVISIAVHPGETRTQTIRFTVTIFLRTKIA